MKKLQLGLAIISLGALISTHAFALNPQPEPPAQANKLLKPIYLVKPTLPSPINRLNPQPEPPIRNDFRPNILLTNLLKYHIFK